MSTHTCIKKVLYIIASIIIIASFYLSGSLAEETFFDFSSQTVFINTITADNTPPVEEKDEESQTTQAVSVDMNGRICLFGIDIFSSSLSDIMDVLEEKGYKTDKGEEEINTLGFIGYECRSNNPYYISLMISVDHKVVDISINFNPNASVFTNVYKSFTSVFGEPLFSEIDENSPWKGNSLLWDSDDIKCTINGGYSGDIPLEIQYYENGTAGFDISIETSINGHSIYYDSKIPPKTLKPRKLYVSIEKVKLKKNSDGFLDLYVRFRNESSFNLIDRIDFDVLCYDAYGNLIYQDNNFDSIDYFYDEKLRHGKLSSSRSHWSLDGYYGVNYVMVAITKYHADIGGTVEQPMSSWDWVICEY